MTMIRRVTVLSALMLTIVSSSLTAQESPRRFAARAIDARFAARLAQGLPQVELESFPLTVNGTAELMLERFEVFTPKAKIVVHSDAGETIQSAPATVFYRGEVLGDENSIAVFRSGEDGTRGWVILGDGRAFIVDQPAFAKGTKPVIQTSMLTVREVDASKESASTKALGNDDARYATPERAAELAALQSRVPTPDDATYDATIAIETDYELFQLLGSSASITSWVADTIAVSSAYYEQDFGINLKVGHISVWNTPSDPWTATDREEALYQLGDYWAANRTDISRATVIFYSPKSLAGYAWIGALCQADRRASNGRMWGGYAIAGNIDGARTTGAFIWETYATAHELGHNFGTHHTHCQSPPADNCYGREQGCYSGPESLPAAGGTIMSYCHQRPGGYANIRPTFGRSTDATNIITQNIRNYLQQYGNCLTQAGGCTAPSITSHPSSGSVAAGATASLTVVVSGTAPFSYQWYEGNAGDTSFPVAGATGSSFTTPAITVPRTYWVRVTNGCGTANSTAATITIGAAADCNAAQTLSCPANVNGTLANTDCLLTDGNRYADKYDVTLTAGQQVTINMTSSFDTYLQLYSGATLVAQNDDIEVSVNTNSRIIYTAGTSGVHRIVATTYDATTSGAYNLTVTGCASSCSGPTIAAQPASTTITAGQNATLSVTAGGNGPFTYQWYIGTPGDTSFPEAGATSSTFTVTGLATTRTYWVRVSNGCSHADSNAATITVSSTPNPGNGPFQFVPLAPCRVHDTRGASGPKLASNGTRTFAIAGRCGIPADAKAVSLNITVTDNGFGYITIWPAGGSQPEVSTINYQAGTWALANAAIVPLGNAGSISLFSAGEPTHVIMDVNGYYK